ncbi:MAG: GSCFA domain-containing protein [Dysgonomonas sp.]|nr:GSCFA domain-containing protein [Dysgonomonas sp.]
MEFRTKIEIPKSNLRLSHKSKILMLGSCFIENIGKRLIENKFDAHLNPFGVLYNPLSISQAIRLLMAKKDFTEKDLFEYKGLYHSFYHHSSFSGIDRDKCLAHINSELSISSDVLKQADTLFITFGTAYVFRFKEDNIIVGNCHKLPASSFDRFKLNVEDIVNDWQLLINSLTEVNPKLQIIFTVSPIRHIKDGLHENQLSKSTLLLAIEKLKQTNSNTYYFPSYEIVLDELRDYRFYNEDMVHPSDTAIKYIWERFSDTYFTQESISIVNEWKKINLALNHRPFNEQGEEYKLFLRQTMLKLQTFIEKYPYICCSNEISYLDGKLQ